MNEIMSIKIGSKLMGGEEWPVYLEIMEDAEGYFISQWCGNSREIVQRYESRDEASRDFGIMVFENGIVGNNP